MVTYTEVTNITHSWAFILPIVIVFIVFMLSWILMGVLRKGRSSNGQKTSRPMGASFNYWLMTIAIFITFLIFAYFIFFPIHLNLLN